MRRRRRGGLALLGLALLDALERFGDLAVLRRSGRDTLVFSAAKLSLSLLVVARNCATVSFSAFTSSATCSLATGATGAGRGARSSGRTWRRRAIRRSRRSSPRWRRWRRAARSACCAVCGAAGALAGSGFLKATTTGSICGAGGRFGAWLVEQFELRQFRLGGLRLCGRFSRLRPRARARTLRLRLGLDLGLCGFDLGLRGLRRGRLIDRGDRRRVLDDQDRLDLSIGFDRRFDLGRLIAGHGRVSNGEKFIHW